jgi:hypothetical protein
MIKSALRHILIGLTVVLSTAVLFVWFHSYFVGSNYRWTEVDTELPDAAFHGTSVTISGGGIGILVEDFVTTDDAVAGFLEEYAQTRWRQGSNRYRTWRSPEFPSLNRTDESIAAALGFQYSKFREAYPGVERVRWQMVFPAWLIFLLTAAYPMSRYMLAVIRQQQEERMALGMCPTCGSCVDDLTDRCPGCDHKVAMA